MLLDGLIKIGFTSDLHSRMQAYPPTARVLATETGDTLLERERHEEFRDYLTARREWFTPGPRLRAHIEGLPTYRAAA